MAIYFRLSCASSYLWFYPLQLKNFWLTKEILIKKQLSSVVMFTNLQELYNSLDSEDLTPMPPPQLIALMSDILEKASSKDLGLLDYLVQQYKK